MISTQTLKGNLINQDYSTAFTLNQGDKEVPFRVELLENGTPYTLLSDDIVTIEWLKPNGNPFLQEGDIKYGTNYIEFTTPESVAQYSGSGSFNIIISNGDLRKGTIRREYKVIPTSFKPGSISEDVITDAITELRELNSTLAATIQTGNLDNYAKKTYVKKEVELINSYLEEKANYLEVNEAIAKAQLEGAGVDTSTFVKTSQLNDALINGKLYFPLMFERGTIAGSGILYESTTDWRSKSFKLGEDTVLTIVLPENTTLVTWRYSNLSENALQAETFTVSGTYTIRGGFYYYFVLKNSTTGEEVTQAMLDASKFYYEPEFDYKEKINNVQAQIDDINSVYATPYTTQEDAIINSIYKILNSSTIIFGLITDNHCGITNWDNLYNHGKVLNSLAERVGADFCINLGDVFVDTTDNAENLSRLYKYWNTNFNTTVPNLYCMGNHEVFPQSDGSTALETWQVISQVNRTNKHIQKGNSSYYYFDIRSCRFIVLDSSSNTNCGFSDEQETFLQEAFNTIGYKKAVIFTHIPLDASLMLQSTPKNADKIRAILTTNKDKVIAVLHGHTHWDNNAKLDEIEQISFCCAMCGKQDVSTFTGVGTPLSYDRAYGTYTEYCMDIVCVDTYKDIIRTFRFGAGSNRIIDCSKTT